MDHGIGNFALPALIEAPAGHIGGIVGRSQHAARGAVSIAFHHLKIIDDLALVPDVVAGSDYIDIQLEEFFGERGRYAEAGGGVFAVGDDEIDEVIAHDSRQAIFHNDSSGPSKDVTNKENAHSWASTSDPNTRKPVMRGAATFVVAPDYSEV